MFLLRHFFHIWIRDYTGVTQACNRESKYEKNGLRKKQSEVVFGCFRPQLYAIFSLYSEFSRCGNSTLQMLKCGNVVCSPNSATVATYVDVDRSSKSGNNIFDFFALPYMHVP